MEQNASSCAELNDDIDGVDYEDSNAEGDEKGMGREIERKLEYKCNEKVGQMTAGNEVNGCISSRNDELSQVGAKRFVNMISNYCEKMNRQVDDMVHFLEKMNRSISDTSEIDQEAVEALKSLPLHWKNVQLTSVHHESTQENLSLNDIASMDTNELESIIEGLPAKVCQEIMKVSSSFDHRMNSLIITLGNVLEVITTCVEAQKREYHSNFKRMQETFRISARNIMLASKSEALTSIKDLQTKVEQENALVQKECNLKIEESQSEIAQIQAVLDNVLSGNPIEDKNGVDILATRDETIRQFERDRFASTLSEEQRRSREIVTELMKTQESNVATMKLEKERELQEMHEKYEEVMRKQAKEENCLRDSLRKEKDRLQEEVESLMQKLADMSNKFSADYRQFESQRETDKDTFQRELESVRSHSTKEMSIFKAELAETVNRHSKELTNLRATLAKSHSYEIKKLSDLAKADMQRY